MRAGKSKARAKEVANVTKGKARTSAKAGVAEELTVSIGRARLASISLADRLTAARILVGIGRALEEEIISGGHA